MNASARIVGSVGLLIAVGFLIQAYAIGPQVSDSYRIFGRFGGVSGLSEGAEVRVGGVPIGRVSAQFVDPGSYDAVVEMLIEGRYRLPADSVAAVRSDGLIGAKYVKITPGSADQMIEPSGRLQNTADAVEIESLVRELIDIATGAAAPEDE